MAGSHYTDSIREDLAAIGLIGVNPYHVEAYMRLEYSTLDHLSREKFREEVRIAADCVRFSSSEENEALAESYGLGEG